MDMVISQIPQQNNSQWVEDVTLSEYVKEFQSKINEKSVRAAFPEMTTNENPIWVGSPSFLSMAGYYFLSFFLFGVHVLFYWAATEKSIGSENQSEIILGVFKWLIDVTDVFGFIIVIFIIAKINHYFNFSTSSRWTTTWLLLNGLVPLFLVSSDFILGYLDISLGGYEIPNWNKSYYLLLGLISSGLMIAMTLLYQKAFTYAITDRRIHISKKFLYLDTSAHGVILENIENLKVSPTLIGKIFDFGNVHLITASGIGLRDDITDLGAGIASSSLSEEEKGLFKSLFGWVTIQRQRKTVDQKPEDCLFGIRKPLKIYRLINELIDDKEKEPLLQENLSE